MDAADVSYPTFTEDIGGACLGDGVHPPGAFPILKVMTTRRGLLLGGLPTAGAALLALNGCDTVGAVAPARETGVFPLRAGEGDTGALAFLLVVEYMQADFYAQARDADVGLERAADFAEQEDEHIDTLLGVLDGIGGAAPDRPTTRFPVDVADRLEVLRLASTLENAATGAYLGQLPRVHDSKVRATLLSIASVEARHAATHDLLLGRGASRVPVARPWRAAQVLDELRPFATIA